MTSTSSIPFSASTVYLSAALKNGDRTGFYIRGRLASRTDRYPVRSFKALVKLAGEQGLTIKPMMRDRLLADEDGLTWPEWTELRDLWLTAALKKMKKEPAYFNLFVAGLGGIAFEGMEIVAQMKAAQSLPSKKTPAKKAAAVAKKRS